MRITEILKESHSLNWDIVNNSNEFETTINGHDVMIKATGGEFDCFVDGELIDTVMDFASAEKAIIRKVGEQEEEPDDKLDDLRREVTKALDGQLTGWVLIDSRLGDEQNQHPDTKFFIEFEKTVNSPAGYSPWVYLSVAFELPTQTVSVGIINGRVDHETKVVADVDELVKFVRQYSHKLKIQ